MKPDFPKTRFSLPVEPRKSLMESRVRAIVESANGRRGRTSVPVAALVLLVCFFCVNLVSCAAVRADSDGQAATGDQTPAEGTSDLRNELSNPSTEPTAPTDPESTEPTAPQLPGDSILKTLESEGELHCLVTVYSEINSGESETDEYMIQITDEAKISEIIDALLEIEWSPKTEGNWPKYSVDRPDYSLEIQTSDRLVKINLFDTGFAAVLTDDWQRYEISESHYKSLKTLLLDK